MNIDYGPLDGFVVPDPWNPTAVPYPIEMRTFTDFISSAVQENSADRLDRRAAIPFVTYLATHGLTRGTASFAARQLLGEQRDHGLTWRRPFVMDAICYDVFRHLINRHQVAYSTFFSNSTAHFQHYFWRNFQPQLFTVPSPVEDHPSLSDAVLAGYRNHDRLLGRLMSDFPDARLILATALSQQPWDTTKCTYRPDDFGRLLALAGIDAGRAVVEPVMAEEFALSFLDEEAVEDARIRLNDCRIGDAPLFRTQQTHPLRLVLGCAVNDWTPHQRVVSLPGGKEVMFDSLFSRIHSLRSGRHHPDGCFWVQSASPGKSDTKIPLTCVAPTVLALFGIEPPSYMKEPPAQLTEWADPSRK